MKKFIKKNIFFSLPILLVLYSGVFLPPTPRASKSHLFSNKFKDSLLVNTENPRIIFVGGSNVSFGINSFKIKDSLNLNPINTAVHQNIGIRYMLENVSQYIKNGDVIILAFEYTHFYRSFDYTSDELLRLVIDVCPKNLRLLSMKQVFSLIKYVPKFSITKYRPSEYRGGKESDVYSVNSFNLFGDADSHWSMENRGYQPLGIQGKFNSNVIIKLKEFEKKARQKGARVYVTFPCLDEISYMKSRDKVLFVEKMLRENHFKIIGNAKRYIMPKEMMFNTCYHLNKIGLDYRTELFIEDFRAKKNNNWN